MQDYAVYGSHAEHIVKPIFEQIDGYFCSMNEENYEFIVCVMNGDREADLTQMKINIKKCGTIRHGKHSFQYELTE